MCDGKKIGNELDVAMYSDIFNKDLRFDLRFDFWRFEICT